MKHKMFDSVKPYGYFLVRKEDNKKYVGVRYANVKYNLTPDEDFGKVYFTSGRLSKEFKKNPENFWFRLAYTFDTIQDMFDWERKIALRIYKKLDWANQGWGQNYGENPIIGQLISEGKNKIGRDGKTSVQRGAESLKDWIWNTGDGEAYRDDISKRITDMRLSWSEEKTQEVQEKRIANMDFSAASKKAQQTMSEVGLDGLTTIQRKTNKMHNTKLESGIYETQGKAFSEWVWNTDEGESYRKQQSDRMLELRASHTEEEKKSISDKLKETLANRSEEEIRYHSNKVKETRSLIGEDGLNDYQRAALKAEQTKLENGVHEKTSKKRGELFNKKLGEMGEEEFEKYCANYIPRLSKSFRTRRNKYLEQVGEG